MTFNLEEAEPDYREEKNFVKKHLKNSGWKNTPEIAKETHTQKHSWKYWRYKLLPAILKKLNKTNQVKKEERPEGGAKTHYWSINNGSEK